MKAGAFDRYFELEYCGRCLLGPWPIWSLLSTGTTETPNKLASAPAPSQVNLISPEVTLILQLYALLFIFN